MRRIFLAALVVAALGRAQVSYKVRLTAEEGNRIVELPAEKYVAAVLAGESATFRSEEALKAMAVAARTYAAHDRGKHSIENFDFCATTHCQRVDLHAITPRLERAAEATAGEMLWFEGKPALAVYTRDCGGETENVRYVWPNIQAPYLRAQPDPYCTRHGVAAWSWTARPSEIATALRASDLNVPEPLQRIVVVQRTESNRAKTLELAGRNRQVAISATSLRFAVGRKLGWNTLRSDRYELENLDDRICFRGAGQGHGVGLCQNGADEMGVEGRTYREILAFYYPGAAVARKGAGFDWQQMVGEAVTVFSTNPDRDRAVLTTGEAVNREVAAQLGGSFAAVTIRVYPDIDAFRNATGEPGWVAARTTGQTIDLQPVTVLQTRGILAQTLHHELLHAAIERQAAPGLPVWFREGLAEYLASPEKTHAVAPPPAVTDADLEQRQNRRRAEAAYAGARTRVAALVHRYGEATVLGWVARGLPEAVRNSSVSSAAANSK